MTHRPIVYSASFIVLFSERTLKQRQEPEEEDLVPASSDEGL